MELKAVNKNMKEMEMMMIFFQMRIFSLRISSAVMEETLRIPSSSASPQFDSFPPASSKMKHKLQVWIKKKNWILIL